MILVTGCAGYLGCEVVRGLLAEEMAVLGVDTLQHGGKGLVPFVHNEDFTFIRGDIASARLPQAHIEAIIHLAGYRLGNYTRAHADADATQKVLSLYRPTLFASSCSIYGAPSPYSESKSVQEEWVLHDGRNTAFRFGTLCGPSANMREDTFVNEMTLRAFRGIKLDVYQPNAMRPYLHVQDAAAAVVEWVLNERKPGAFNVVAENLSKSDIVTMIQQRCPDTRVEYIEQGDPRNYTAESQINGWEMFRIADAIDHIIEAETLCL